MCFTGKASTLAQRNKYYAYIVEGRKPKGSSRQILKDRCWFKQKLYMGGNKGQRKSDWMQDMKNKQKPPFRCYSLYEESTFQIQICNRFICIQIIKLEQDKFATQRTQFSRTEQINTRLAERSLPLTAASLLGPFFPNSCILVCNLHFFFGW